MKGQRTKNSQRVLKKTWVAGVSKTRRESVVKSAAGGTAFSTTGTGRSDVRAGLTPVQA